MERLTKRDNNGRAIAPEFADKTYIMQDDNDNFTGYINSPIVDRLAELEDKIESGTLVELPAPLGSELWTIKYPTHKHGKETVTVLSVKNATVERNEYPLSLSNLDMVGKYYFLTREEAEKRLEEFKNAEN